MPPFRSLPGGKAGPKALGILVPPGNRTVVVLRPRGLNVDLVLARSGPDGQAQGFFETSRQSAGLEAQELHRALLNGVASGVEVAAVAEGYHIQAGIAQFALVACARVPGQPYRPLVCGSDAEAQQTADELRQVLCPDADANQELYTNMSQFGR